MKGNRILFALILVLLTAALGTLAGCKQPAGDSVEDCMSKFKTAVNNQSWSDLKDLTSTDAGDHNTADSTTWPVLFTEKDFTYIVIGSSATVSCGVAKYTFELEKNSDEDYKVRYIYLFGTSTALFK